MGDIVFYTDRKITVSRIAPVISVYVGLGVDGVEVRNGKRLYEVLVKGKDNILMLIQAQDKEQSSQPYKQWPRSQKVCSDKSLLRRLV